MTRPEWHARANCGRNGIIGDDPTERVRIMFGRQADRVCEGCPVAVECDQAATGATGRLYGTWNGSEETGQRHRERCAHCFEVFEPSSPYQRVCSDECRAENIRRINRETSRRARLAS